MPSQEITLRFLAAPTDVARLGGDVQGGRVMEWIDKAGYACAVGWSAAYCVTAYVGNIHFIRPIASGNIVEVTARIIHTGRSSMHIFAKVSSADPRDGHFADTAECLMIFVAVDSSGASTPVPPWRPTTPTDVALQADAVSRIALREQIVQAMSGQVYTEHGTAPQSTLRFLAAPTDVNWGGKVHGGNVMRWIDEAAYVCATGWNRSETIAVYSGGIRFYRPMHIGNVVELQARLLYTSPRSMHVSVHVRSGPPATREMALTTHSLIVFVARGDDGRADAVRQWIPRSEEDRHLQDHAITLNELRRRPRMQ